MVRKELLCMFVAFSILTGSTHAEWFRLRDLAIAESTTACDAAEPSLALCDTESICDGLARSRSYELPVGVVTNVLGAIFFLYLLATRDTSPAEAH